MRWGKTTWRWVEYQQGTWPSPQNSKQPDLEFSLYGHYLPLPKTCLYIILTFIVMLNTMVVWQNVSCIIFPKWVLSYGNQLWYRIYNLNSYQHCVIPENIHTPPTEGIWNLAGGGGVGGGWSSKGENVSKCMKLDWNFQRGGGSQEKSLPWGRYG